MVFFDISKTTINSLWYRKGWWPYKGAFIWSLWLDTFKPSFSNKHLLLHDYGGKVQDWSDDYITFLRQDVLSPHPLRMSRLDEVARTLLSARRDAEGRLTHIGKVFTSSPCLRNYLKSPLPQTLTTPPATFLSNICRERTVWADDLRERGVYSSTILSQPLLGSNRHLPLVTNLVNFLLQIIQSILLRS